MHIYITIVLSGLGCCSDQERKLCISIVYKSESASYVLKYILPQATLKVTSTKHRSIVLIINKNRGNFDSYIQQIEQSIYTCSVSTADSV